MGVTKRVAEMTTLAMQSARNRFMAVRFGNVLGSNGSVVPVFRQQIERGGPVTVTHPDATRFLMTIPEAAQLVLQASMMATTGGKLLVLEFSKVARPLEKAYDWYSFGILPRLGRLVAGDEASYRYLAESIRMHPGQEELKAMMK